MNTNKLTTIAPRVLFEPAMKLAGQNALVTGGAVRIGRAICSALADNGCNVVIHYNTSESEAETLANDLRNKGVNAWTVQGALRSQQDCSDLIKCAMKSAGSLNILVNNASVFGQKPLISTTPEEISAQMNINLLAPAFLMREFAESAHRGRIVNLLDTRISRNSPAPSAYLLAKKALAELTADIALELAPHITVNGVAPGPVLPPPGRAPGSPPVRAGHIPLHQRPTPAAVAAAVIFLLQADSITGQILFVDGGQHLAPQA